MRARLIIPLALGILGLAVAAQALASVGPPTQTAPADGAMFTAGDGIVFQASVDATTPPPPTMFFFISRQDNPMATAIDQLQGGQTGGDATTAIFSASPSDDKAWPQKPDTYHWQAAYQDCAQAPSPPAPPGCFVPSAGQQTFTINPKAASTVNSPEDLDTFLDHHPKHRTHKRKVRFSFSSNVQHARFQCFYANGWAKCKSPHVFHHLRPGRYKFKVRAKANGVKDKTPASWVFRILR